MKDEILLENEVVFKKDPLQAYFMARDCEKVNKNVLQDVIINVANDFLKRNADKKNLLNEETYRKAEEIAEAACEFAIYVRFDGLDKKALKNVVEKMGIPKYINRFNANVKNVTQESIEKGI